MHAFRCAVICFSFQLVQFGMIVTFIKNIVACKRFVRSIALTRCWEERASVFSDDHEKRDCAREMTHIKAAICTVQVFPFEWAW